MAAPITHDERRTNERPGVRAQHRFARVSAYKAREVLDLIRGKSVAEARTMLQFLDRAVAETVAKVLDSAVANAANNNDIPPEELFVASAYADEGPTLKRWRPRARGRATRIRKRTCHITIIVGRYSPEELTKVRERMAGRERPSGDAAADRARRVARSRAAQEQDDATEDGATADEGAEDSAADTALAEDESVQDADETAADDTAAADTDTAADDAATADEDATASEDGENDPEQKDD